MLPTRSPPWSPRACSSPRRPWPSRPSSTWWRSLSSTSAWRPPWARGSSSPASWTRTWSSAPWSAPLTTVAIELAASWKPFMKSNSKASTTSRITTHRAACTDSITKRLREGSGILEDDALDQVGHVLAAVGHRLQQLVDGLELDDFAHIGLFAEQLAHGRAHQIGRASCRERV